jgi:parallel beta-helix repeat protein
MIIVLPNRYICCLFVCSLLLAACLNSASADPADSIYYVAPDGDDLNNDGSEAHPWQTIHKAADTMAPGDKVLVREGIYREAVHIEITGTADGPIIYQAHPGEQVILEGQVSDDDILNEAWQPYDSPPIYFAHVSQWNLGQVFEDGQELAKVYSTSVLRRGSWYINEWQDILYIWCFDDAAPDEHDITLVLNHGFFLNGVDYITVDGFELRDFYLNGLILKESSHNTISSNLIHDSGASGIEVAYEDSAHNLLEGNITFHNGLQTGGSSGISIWRGGPGNIVRRNISYNNKQPDELYADGNGFIVDLSFESGALLENNLAFDNDGSGISVTESSNVTIRNNTLAHNGQGEFSEDNRCGIFVTGSGSQDGSVIVNNITSDNYRCELGITSDATSGDYHIDYNNWYRSGGTPPIFWGGYQWTLAEFQASTSYGDHSLSIDPQFQSPAADNYHLRSTSEAIDAGDNENAPPDDLNGNPRPVNERVDVGAYEFSEFKIYLPIIYKAGGYYYRHALVRRYAEWTGKVFFLLLMGWAIWACLSPTKRG